ncbi:MAG TPA: FGGY family carbohydrate kinase [Acidimicrobiales bacterium]|nr:FGGY family carbohydrate kinase [Acidimicrobiales bacterium]
MLRQRSDLPGSVAVLPSDSEELVVGIDVATAEVRVICTDGTGRLLAEGRAPLPEPERPRPGWSEQDAAAWWPATTAALREATDALGPRARAIFAVAVAATSGTVVILDDDGSPLAPALLYDDQRAAAQAESAAEAGAERWAALGFRPGASSGLAKWGWLLGRPEISDRAGAVAHASDLVVAGLTGDRRPPTDWSHALKSGYDPARHEWAAEALTAVGVPSSLLPQVRPPSSSAGSVSREAAEATGLPAGCDVRLGMTDGCAGQVAAGADRPHRFVTVVGTTMVVKGATEELVVDPSGAVYCHRHPGGWWLPGGASNTGGAAVADAFGNRDLAELDRRAQAHGPSASVGYPLRGTGERFPFVVSDAEGFWLEEPDGEIERYRAVLEGVAFLERLAYAHLDHLGARPDNPVRSAGQGGRSRVWAAIRATVLDRPVAVAERADTATGAAVLAAAGTLHADLPAAVSAMVEAGEEVAPVDAEREPLDGSYRRFVDALAERGWIGDDLRDAALGERADT